MMFVESKDLSTAIESLGCNSAGSVAAILRANDFEYRSINWELREGPGGVWALMRSAQTGSQLVQRFFPRREAKA